MCEHTSFRFRTIIRLSKDPGDTPRALSVIKLGTYHAPKAPPRRLTWVCVMQEGCIINALRREPRSPRVLSIALCHCLKPIHPTGSGWFWVNAATGAASSASRLKAFLPQVRSDLQVCVCVRAPERRGQEFLN